MTLLKLQINENGSWRDILRFDFHNEPEVREAARQLVRLAGQPKLKLRIHHKEDGVQAYCAGPDFVWRSA